MSGEFWKARTALLLLALLWGGVQGSKKKVTFAEGVAILTTDNFDAYVKAYKHVMVKFYAPWCGHCKKMAPDYAKLAQKMKGNADGIAIAKLDATVEGEIGERYKVKSFPTLFFFMNGEPVEYNGAREGDAMENWMKEQVRFVVPELETVEDAKAKEDSKLAAILTCSPDDKALMARFRILALANAKVPFFVSHSREVAEHFAADDLRNMILIRNFDEGTKTLKLEKTTPMKTLKEFWGDYSKPIVSEFEETAQEIFGNRTPSIFFFTDSPQGKAWDEFYELAKRRRRDINFVRSTLGSGVGQKVSDMIGLKPTDNNTVRILRFEGQDIRKYRPTNSSPQGLSQFIDDFKANKLKYYLKSQPAPKNDRKPVKTIVSDNFDELVNKSNKHVLLKVYAPWCKHCQNIAPVFTLLGKKLANVSELMVGEYDATANEHPSIKVDGYPVIYLFKIRQKKKPIEYKGAPTFSALIKFLEKELDRDLIFPDDMEEGDDL